MVSSSFVFALALVTTAAGQVTLPDLLPERPPPTSSSVSTASYYAESPWEFGAEGAPSAEATSFDGSLSAALAPEGGFAAANPTCQLCCAGVNACDQICLGGLFGRSVRNTVYFAFVGGAIGCFGGVVLGLIPAFLIATVAGALVTNIGGLIAATLLGCGGVGCLAGAGAGAPLGFYSAVLFPWWNPGGDEQQTTVIIDDRNDDPPPQARRRRRQAPSSSSEPRVEHREERREQPRVERRERKRSRSDRKAGRSRSSDDDDDDKNDRSRRRRSPRR